MKKTIRNDGLHQLEVGDRVQLISNQYRNLKGEIIKIDSDDFGNYFLLIGIVTIKTFEKVPFELKV